MKKLLSAAVALAAPLALATPAQAALASDFEPRKIRQVGRISDTGLTKLRIAYRCPVGSTVLAMAVLTPPGAFGPQAVYGRWRECTGRKQTQTVGVRDARIVLGTLQAFSGLEVSPRDGTFFYRSADQTVPIR